MRHAVHGPTGRKPGPEGGPGGNLCSAQEGNAQHPELPPDGSPHPRGAQAGGVSTPAMGDRGLSIGGRAGFLPVQSLSPGCSDITVPDNLPFLCAFIGHSGTTA